TYPLFVSPPYTLALATKMAEVAAHAKLDLLHVHYALPHAISAILAREMSRDIGDGRLRVVTTLHGTDITIVGQDRSYLPITRFGIEKSDAVTAVSRHLADVTVRELGVRQPVEGIPNVVAVETILPIGRIFLLPSNTESFGLAGLEAMACGVPVIGTAAGGLPEVVVDGETGYLRPVGDVEGMAEAALDLIRDREKWQR